LVIIIIGAAAFLLHTLNTSSLQTERNKVTADALAKAKDALIAYAVTYGDTHPGYAHGYLPSPDPNGLISGANGEGSSEPSPGTNVSAIGRLPWKTLDLPPLRDGNGECLWYAVAGNYKSNTLPSYTLMNWDNYGLFQILAATGVPLTATQDTYAVAAVFSPGVALSGQNRSSDGSAPICGGNYTPSNYLDSDAGISANNATVSATANAINTFFNAGASAKINDQIIYITSSDIFNAVKKRSDFGTFVNAMLSDALNNVQNYKYSTGNLPTPVYITFSNTAAPSDSTSSTSTASGNIYHGKIPKNMLSPQYQNWQDNIQYGKCTFGNCLTQGFGNYCDGIIIFSGERNSSLNLIRTVANKNNSNNYLESPVASPFSFLPYSPNNFSGATSYNPGSPSADVLKCIP